MNSNGILRRVACYLRVSTFGQTQKEFGSLEKQLENAKEMVGHNADNGWVFVREYRDSAISGTDDSRPGLNELMAAAERHEFDIIVFQFLDRLSRHASYTLGLLERLHELKIDVYDSDGFRVDITTPEGLVRTGIGALLAQAAHQKMVSATRKGVQTMASEGYLSGGMAQFGYDRIEDPKVGIAPNPAEAPIMQEAYARLAKDEDLSDIVSDFRKRGIRTKIRVFNKGDDNERQVGGMLFNTDILERMIRNPIYRGKIRGRYDAKAASSISVKKPLEMDKYGEGFGIYQGRHELLVSDEIWWQANKALDRRTKRKMPRRPVDPAGRFLLQGRLRCGCCKCQMATTYSRGHTGAKFYYYKCHHHIEEGPRSNCSVRSLPMTLVHEAILRFLTRVIMQPEIIAATLEAVKGQAHDDKGRHHRALKEVNAQLASVRGEISQCIDAITKKLVPALLPDLRERAENLKEKEKCVLQEQIQLTAMCRVESSGYPTETAVIATLNDFVMKFECLSGPEQKELVGLLVKDVTVFNATGGKSKSGDSKPTRWRFLVRLQLDAPTAKKGENKTLPLQFTIELPSSRAWQFRFIEPFQGIEVETCSPKKKSAVDEAEDDDGNALSLDSHPMMVATNWVKKSTRDPSLTRAKYAKELGKSRGLITKYLELLKLDAHIRTVLTSKPSGRVLRHFSYRKLLRLLKLPLKEQLENFRRELRAVNPSP